MERNATASAQKGLTQANALVLSIIRDVVVPNVSASKMSDVQLTRYSKLVQLETMLEAPFLYHPKGSSGTVDSNSAWARLRTVRAGQSLLTGENRPVASGRPAAPAPPKAATLTNLEPGEGRRLLAAPEEFEHAIVPPEL